MAGLQPNFPQAPRGRIVSLTGRLQLPPIAPFTPLAMRGKALELKLRHAPVSSPASVARFNRALADAGWSAGPGYPDLHDELEPYLDDRAPDDKAEEIAKVRTEFAVYSRIVDRMPAPDAMDLGAFVALLLDTHRRLGTGINGLRTRGVAVRPDAAGNRVIFPDHRQCPALLADLHAFLCDHSARHPALCATATYAALIHAHPFNDGNGRTARTLYNLVLSAATGARHFVPIHLIAAHHRGSFLIKLRRALYQGDWNGLQGFFCDAGELSRQLQHGHGGEPGPLVVSGNASSAGECL